MGGGGGGSGGSLKISACNLSFDAPNSEVQANGGNGGKSYGYGKISMLLSLIMLLYHVWSSSHILLLLHTKILQGYGGGGGGGGIVKINASNHNIDEIVISISGGARGEGATYPDTRSGYAGNSGPAALINGGMSFAIE